MATVVHFNMIVDINQLLKKKGIEYSIHALGGCSCCGLQLRQDGKKYPEDKIVEIINDYLNDKWMQVVADESGKVLNVQSKFDYEK